MRAFLILMLVPIALTAQPKYEVQEFTGVVKSIGSGFGFALQQIVLDINGELNGFLFNPGYGSWVVRNVKVGESLTLRANVNVKYAEMRKRQNNRNAISPVYFFHDQILAIKTPNGWYEMPDIKEEVVNHTEVFLEKKVIDEYVVDGKRTALILENGLVGYYHPILSTDDKMRDIKIGDYVSFGSYRRHIGQGFEFPISGVKDVYYFNRLIGVEAKLHSYLFKQNFVRIGAKFKTTDGKMVSVAFPSEDAKRIERFIKPEIPLKFYYSDFKIDAQPMALPELHAIVQNADTLYIRTFGFFGGADGKHEHDPVEITGKITRINVTPKGNVSSLIIDSDYYVEIDAMMAQQLALHFQKGKQISIQGKQRIKKEGEIYQKSYHIVVPERLTIDGKTFSVYIP
ncbi:MAG: hypothetical protein KF763_20250 [Cyclobacteriaceae bacterium]|nr:hypothetical protein [Cyclobacteriaceae bacterium]